MAKGNYARLAAALASLKSNEEADRFIADLLTEEEKRSLTKRLHIADWLTSGKTYEQIVSGIGTSMTTVARVSHWLKKGGDGYRVSTQRLAKLQEKAKTSNGSKSSRSPHRGAGKKSKPQKASARSRSSAQVVRAKKRSGRK